MTLEEKTVGNLAAWLMVLAASVGAGDVQYPAHWWTAVPREGAPAWEILPQEAGPGEVIVSKRHELGLLSNFAPTPFVFRGKRYASVEGFWQMMLYPEGSADPRAVFPGLHWSHTRDQVSQMVAFEAKDAGTAAERNMTRMGIDWVSFEGERFPYRPAQPGRHYELIVAAMHEKVRQNPDVQRVLLSTGDLILKPDHHEEPGGKAAWRYCDILMGIRAELRRAARSPRHSPDSGRTRQAVYQPSHDIELRSIEDCGYACDAGSISVSGTPPSLIMATNGSTRSSSNSTPTRSRRYAHVRSSGHASR